MQHTAAAWEALASAPNIQATDSAWLQGLHGGKLQTCLGRLGMHGAKDRLSRFGGSAQGQTTSSACLVGLHGCRAALHGMQGAFGDALKGVEQVEAVNTSATAAAVDAHLDMLRPAITSYGATVQVWLGYHNPNPSLPPFLCFLEGLLLVRYVCAAADVRLKRELGEDTRRPL